MGWPFYKLWEGSPSPSWALACPWSLPWDQLSWVRFRQGKEHPMSLHKSWFEISDCEYRTDNDRSHILRTVFHCDGLSWAPQKCLLDICGRTLISFPSYLNIRIEKLLYCVRLRASEAETRSTNSSPEKRQTVKTFNNLRFLAWKRQKWKLFGRVTIFVKSQEWQIKRFCISRRVILFKNNFRPIWSVDQVIRWWIESCWEHVYSLPSD